jgi:hypothetical protein
MSETFELLPDEYNLGMYSRGYPNIGKFQKLSLQFVSNNKKTVNQEIGVCIVFNQFAVFRISVYTEKL